LKSHRDAFISELFNRAKQDSDIILISVDMGAPSLDVWRRELPEQFFTAGISEQNAINFAAGLSSTGKKVYVYFMACWTARCLEQIRYSCAMPGNGITILGNSVGLGYSPAGPAHNPTEDIAYMKSIFGLEIYSPATSQVAQTLVSLTCGSSKLRYIRFERSYPEILDETYPNPDERALEGGILEVKSDENAQIGILSSGYMLGRALGLSQDLKEMGYSTSVVDLFRIKPINTPLLKNLLVGIDIIVTLEEQGLCGGFGSSICEAVTDMSMKKEILRLGLPEKYLFDNGNREHLLNSNGLSSHDIFLSVQKFLKSLDSNYLSNW